MSEDDTQAHPGDSAPTVVPLDRNGGGDGTRPRVYKLRIALILIGLGALAMVSTVFGMMMAVASDLPALENRQEYRNAKNSILYDVNGEQIGILTGRQNRILVRAQDISPAMEHAVIAIEDRRFYEHSGVDPRGIARAVIADIGRQKAVQGASTIPQQFVKNALAAQQQRTVFQKLRESALAYHLGRKWSKQKILTEYLNSIYFGNGAYGVEQAARTYFEYAHVGCGAPGAPNCASVLTPAEGALIAGIIASPTAWDPVEHPQAAKQRRDTVLAAMHDQGYLSKLDYRNSVNTNLPQAGQIQPPREASEAPYFTTWVKNHVIERFGAQRALNGGLKIRTTLDIGMQRAAENAVRTYLEDPKGPAAALVAIDNRTGEVRALVGNRVDSDYRDDYSNLPFNLATQGQRQPGSSFKAFILAAALREGASPDDSFESKQKEFTVPNSKGQERFVVNNFEGQYAGVTSLASATQNSDNSVFAELGIKTGTGRIAKIAREMGIRTPISTNYAMTLGGLKQGVTPLDMAHAFQTLANGGQRISGSLGAPQQGPVGIVSVEDPRGRVTKNREVRQKVFSKQLAETETEMLRGVVTGGTGKDAATGGFVAGKTGTTENYGDAWFVGYTKRMTVAVWVGYPDGLRTMKTEYNGGPVTGGSFPANIFREFVIAADQIIDEREAAKAEAQGKEYTPPEGSSGSRSGDEGSGETSGDSGGDTSGDSSGDTSGDSSGDTSGDTGGGSGGGGADPGAGGDTGGADPGGGDSGGSGGSAGGTAPEG
ncbi:MAG: transglycosylase domain-containing protein [Solirubrobacteraceae bacterium]